MNFRNAWCHVQGGLWTLAYQWQQCGSWGRISHCLVCAWATNALAKHLEVSGQVGRADCAIEVAAPAMVEYNGYLHWRTAAIAVPLGDGHVWCLFHLPQVMWCERHAVSCMGRHRPSSTQTLDCWKGLKSEQCVAATDACVYSRQTMLAQNQRFAGFSCLVRALRKHCLHCGARQL